MKMVFSVIALCSLVACGGGGDGGAPAPAAVAPCVPLTQVTIQLFGDSTMEGYEGGTSSLAVITPAIALQAALDAEFGRGSTLVTVRAMAGTTAAELVDGTDGRNLPWPGSVAADVVVVNHGINDMVRYGGPGYDGYRASLRTLAQAPAVVIFETPNITKGWDSGPYAQAMREVAAERGLAVADTYAFTAALPDWQTLIPDWAHPTSALYQRIGAEVLAPVVAKQVSKLRCP